jgi:hypothetical protein
MDDDALRQELEAAYRAALDAIESGDADAFLAAVQAPAPGAEEAMRADFENARPIFQQMLPDPRHTLFVAVRAAGDDLAGYYHVRLNPYSPTRGQVLLTLFARVEGRWRLALRGVLHGFDHALELDLVEEALALVDTEAELQLRPPAGSS